MSEAWPRILTAARLDTALFKDPHGALEYIKQFVVAPISEQWAALSPEDRRVRLAELKESEFKDRDCLQADVFTYLYSLFIAHKRTEALDPLPSEVTQALKSVGYSNAWFVDEGCFAQVFSARAPLSSGEAVAVKVGNGPHALLREIAVNEFLRRHGGQDHPNVTLFTHSGCVEVSSKVLEYSQLPLLGESVMSICSPNSGASLTLTSDQRIDLAWDTIHGVAFFHSLGCTLVDLHPGNIMVSAEKRASLIDFEFVNGPWTLVSKPSDDMEPLANVLCLILFSEHFAGKEDILKRIAVGPVGPVGPVFDLIQQCLGAGSAIELLDHALFASDGEMPRERRLHTGGPIPPMCSEKRTLDDTLPHIVRLLQCPDYKDKMPADLDTPKAIEWCNRIWDTEKA